MQAGQECAVLIELSPQIEELSVGHLGRLAFVNRLADYRVKHVLSATLERSGIDIANTTLMDMLALISKFSSIDYAQRHSMLPALRFTSSDDVIYPHGEPLTKRYTKHRGMLTPRDGAFVCNECMYQDRIETGLSWFRRSHHLMGVDWCPTHGSLLLQVDARSPHFAPPHIWQKRGKLRALPAFVDRLELAGEFVRNYVAVAGATLTMDRPLPTVATHRTLGVAAAAKDLRRAQVGSQRPLSDLVRELAPAEWLAAHIPGLNEKPPMAYMSRVDDLLGSSTPASGDSYILAFAALYSDPVAELHSLRNPNGYEDHSARMPRRTRGANFWQGEVWGHYLKSHGSHSQMAAKLDMPTGYLSQRMRSLGLPDLSNSFSEEVWRAFNDFQGGNSLRSVCVTHDVSLAQLEPLLRISGVRIAKARALAEKEVQRPILRRRRKNLPGTP